MLPYAYRLTPKEAKVLKTGKNETVGSMRLLWKPAAGSLSKWQVVVFKHTVPKAVTRHRLKRIVTEALWSLVPQLKTGGRGIIYITRPFPDAFKTQDAQKGLMSLLTKAKVI